MWVNAGSSFWASVKVDVRLSESKLSKAIINLNILFQRIPAFTPLENKALMRHCTIVQMISICSLLESYRISFALKRDIDESYTKEKREKGEFESTFFWMFTENGKEEIKKYSKKHVGCIAG